jgi:hypothetical protein
MFNRPDTTARVFEAIREAEPPQLLVIADGPRPDHPQDVEKCAAARAIIEGVDWDCEVLTDFAESNMGCGLRVSSGLDWVFSEVEKAIILEDDCLPHPTFFRFCQELLDKYRHDKRIMGISGNNFQFGWQRTSYSYYFSRYSHCWGWATWRRAWRHYDREMELWPVVRKGNWLQDMSRSKYTVAYWTRMLSETYAGKIDTWDYQWLLSCWIQSGLTVLPNVNLVSNIGFRPDATHTTGASHYSNMPVEPMPFPLQHPPFVIRDAKADSRDQEIRYEKSQSRIRMRIKMLLKQAGLFQALHPCYSKMKNVLFHCN